MGRSTSSLLIKACLGEVVLGSGKVVSRVKFREFLVTIPSSLIMLASRSLTRLDMAHRWSRIGELNFKALLSMSIAHLNVFFLISKSLLMRIRCLF